LEEVIVTEADATKMVKVLEDSAKKPAPTPLKKGLLYEFRASEKFTD
jgi:hypothetical protein